MDDELEEELEDELEDELIVAVAVAKTDVVVTTVVYLVTVVSEDMGGSRNVGLRQIFNLL